MFMPLKPELLEFVPKKGELSPAQKFRVESILSEKFGREGMRVYFVLDGSRSIKQVIAETGITEPSLLRILEFLSTNNVLNIRQSMLVEDMATAPTETTAPEIASADAGVIPLLRSESEKRVYDKFGTKGVAAFRLVGTASNPDEISTKTGITGEELASLLDFLYAEGLIGLETPVESAPEETHEEKAEKSKALVTEVIEKSEAEAPKAQTALPITVPEKTPLGALERLNLDADLFARYGTKGVKLFEAIDGFRPSTRLCREADTNFSFADPILAYLESKNAITQKVPTEDELRDVYGDEGVAINDVYGREGLLLYELIDRRAVIKEVILKSGIPPQKGVEIYGFIHKVLGIELPFDSSQIMKQF